MREWCRAIVREEAGDRQTEVRVCGHEVCRTGSYLLRKSYVKFFLRLFVFFISAVISPKLRVGQSKLKQPLHTAIQSLSFSFQVGCSRHSPSDPLRSYSSPDLNEGSGSIPTPLSKLKLPFSIYLENKWFVRIQFIHGDIPTVLDYLLGLFVKSDIGNQKSILIFSKGRAYFCR